MIQLLACNPWRPVDAWWQRTTGILRGDPQASVRRDSGRGCGWIKQAERFQLALREASTHHDQMQVMIDFPAIYWAHWLHQQQPTAGPPIRSVIEARILARQTDAEIAQTTGCVPETIEAYEALFFNVRERLDYRDFIVNSVIGLDAARGSQRIEPSWLWKLLGYLGGPHVLDAVISGVPNLMRVDRPDAVASFFHDLAIGSLRQKAAVAALLVSADGATCFELLKSYLKHVEIERNTTSAGSAQDQIQDNLQALLESLPFKAVSVTDLKQLPAYDRAAAELRTDELLQMGVGIPVPGLAEIQGLRFPEPASR